MTSLPEEARRIQSARVVIMRFAPVMDSPLSAEWTGLVESAPEWVLIGRLTGAAMDSGHSMRVDDFESLRAALADVLDSYDEEPMGDTYYPFKAAELIELHCRMVTGDLSERAPVPLAEWISRFARHVDWQLEKSGVTPPEPQYFEHQEVAMQSEQLRLTGLGDEIFIEVAERSRRVGSQYRQLLTAALRVT